LSLPATTGGTERLVIVQEVERARRRDPAKPMFDAIRDAVWSGFEVAPSAIILIEPGSVPRTSSGKIRRGATRVGFLEGSLPVIAAWEQPSLAPTPAPLRPNSADLRPWLFDWLAERLQIPATTLDPDESFARYGMDSVTAEALAAALAERLGAAVPQTIVWDHPTPNRLLASLPGAARRSVAPAPALAPRAGSRGGDLEELLEAIEQEAGGRRG
jgi:acyl carrier protein